MFPEFALFGTKIQVVVCETLENFMNNLSMRCQVVALYEDVIEINSDLSFSYEVREDGVHESLESSRRVGKTEKHNTRFEKSMVSDKCGFPLISFFDSDVMITPAYIELSKDLCILELVDNIGSQG